jgi:hypothetical protein
LPELWRASLPAGAGRLRAGEGTPTAQGLPARASGDGQDARATREKMAASSTRVATEHPSPAAAQRAAVRFAVAGHALPALLRKAMQAGGAGLVGVPPSGGIRPVTGPIASALTIGLTRRAGLA